MSLFLKKNQSYRNHPFIGFQGKKVISSQSWLGSLSKIMTSFCTNCVCCFETYDGCSLLILPS